MSKHQLVQWHQSSGEATLKLVSKKSLASIGQTQHSQTVQEEGLQAALLVAKGELLSVDQW